MKLSALLSSALISTLVFFSTAAAAEKTISEKCNSYTTSYDVTYCYSKLFIESDNELNQVYKALRGQLDNTTKQALTQTQRAWIPYRNGRCSYGGTINVDCNYTVNVDRTRYLQDRLRECKVGQCDKEAIARKSWSH